MRDLIYYYHELFRVTTNNGEVYALDLTSSQYGHYEPILPWNSYEKLRSRRTRKVLSFGDTEIDDYLFAQTSNRSKDHEKYERFLSYSRACLSAALQDWETLHMAFDVLIRLPDQEFVQKRSELYAHIGADLEFLIPQWSKRIAGSGQRRTRTVPQHFSYAAIIE